MGLFGKHTTDGNDTNVLRDEKQKARIIVNSIDDAVILIDNQNTIQNFNPAASLISGWPQDEASGIDYRTVVKLVDDKSQAVDDTNHPFFQVFQQRSVVKNNTLSFQRRDNSAISVDITVSPLLDSNSNITGAVAVIRNVEQQRKQDQQRGDFISTASHEMRTPVAAIEGYLALALNAAVCDIDDKARSYLDKAHASTQHLGQLFQDLLTSAKAEDGRLTSHPTVVDMGELVNTIAEGLTFPAQKKGLKLEQLASASNINPLYYVHADPDRMREVITNLFDNAVKYTETGSITVGITGDKDVVQFSIKDSGIGIPPEDVPHLFQKFYRVDNSGTRTIGGTGLGLFICQKIVELYNGRIWVESTLGEGSTFYINLPRLSSSEVQKLLAKQAETPNPKSPVGQA